MGVPGECDVEIEFLGLKPYLPDVKVISKLFFSVNKTDSSSQGQTRRV